jgi:hypothetical protein
MGPFTLAFLKWVFASCANLVKLFQPPPAATTPAPPAK